MYIGHTTAPDRCPRCLRTKGEALADHIRLQEDCDCQDCPFREEIHAAVLREKEKTRISFGPVRKPAFTFSEHKEKTLKDIFSRVHQTLDKYR